MIIPPKTRSAFGLIWRRSPGWIWPASAVCSLSRCSSQARNSVSRAASPSAGNLGITSLRQLCAFPSHLFERLSSGDLLDQVRREFLVWRFAFLFPDDLQLLAALL